MFSLGEKQVFYCVLDKDFCDIVVLFISGLYSNRISLFEQNCTLIRNKDYENINYMSQVWFPIEQRFIVSILNRYIIFIINYSDHYCETTNTKMYTCIFTQFIAQDPKPYISACKTTFIIYTKMSAANMNQ